MAKPEAGAPEELAKRLSALSAVRDALASENETLRRQLQDSDAGELAVRELHSGYCRFLTALAGGA